MDNEYGVDVNYFKKELKHLSDSLDNRTPEELHRYLMVLANTARPLSSDAVLADVRAEIIKLFIKSSDSSDVSDTYYNNGVMDALLSIDKISEHFR